MNKVKEIMVKTPDVSSVFIEPVSGFKVSYEGTMVPNTPFWQRRVMNGDVLLAEGHSLDEDEPAAAPEETEASFNIETVPGEVDGGADGSDEGDGLDEVHAAPLNNILIQTNKPEQSDGGATEGLILPEELQEQKAEHNDVPLFVSPSSAQDLSVVEENGNKTNTTDEIPSVAPKKSKTKTTIVK